LASRAWTIHVDGDLIGASVTKIADAAAAFRS